jgi:hypothetical protein
MLCLRHVNREENEQRQVALSEQAEANRAPLLTCGSIVVPRSQRPHWTFGVYDPWEGKFKDRPAESRVSSARPSSLKDRS